MSQIFDEKTEKQIDWLVEVQGYERDSIHIEKEYFAIDDILYSRDMEIPEEKHTAAGGTDYPTAGKVTQVDIIIINITPSEEMSEEWINAIHYAVGQWNALRGVNKTFKVIQANWYLGSCVRVEYKNFLWTRGPRFSSSAFAFFPVNGYPGKKIYINTLFYDSDHTINEKRGIMMHEIGHTMGLRHTIDGADYSCGYKISIMYKTNNNRIEFNTCDKGFIGAHY